MTAGLTGGIGSGKSVVAKLFELLGCAVFNSDQTAKEIYFDSGLQPQIVGLLGKEAYRSETEINRAHISAAIFNDPEILLKLNAIIHPAVISRFKAFAAQQHGRLIIKETALLFETKQQAQMDKVILVVANDALRVKRVMQRDQLTEAEVLKKMNSQLPQAEKIKLADFVIDNNETQFLIPQVLKVYKALAH